MKPLKISLLFSLIGISFLLMLSNLLEPKLTKIKDIDSSLLSKKVKIQGEVTNIKSYKESNFCIISIKDDTGKIDVTLDKILNLKKNQTISITGIVAEYEDALQVRADKITG